MPRPAMISARPPESKSSVAYSSNTRTGSAVARIVTALARRIAFVCAAIAASATVVAETVKSSRWCSPSANTESPALSASFACASTSPSRSAAVSRAPVTGSAVRSPKL